MPGSTFSDQTRKLCQKTFGEARSASERLAPHVFDQDREGEFLSYAEELRELADATDGNADEKDQAVAERLLDDDDYHYVKELIRVYDAARCYFVREVISPSFVKLIQSDRLEHRIDGAASRTISAEKVQAQRR